MSRDKPGPGWSLVGPAVWDHTSGLRVHSSGMCILPDGHVIVGRVWPEIKSLKRFIRVNGGNERRGAMAWAIGKLHKARKS